MEVIIRPSIGGQFILPVGLYETMLQIKLRTQLIIGISTSNLTLYLHGHRLHDHLTVAETIFFPRTIIDAVVTPPRPPIDLIIRPSNDNNTFTITLHQYWGVTIRHIKELIHQVIHIPSAYQTLFHGYQLLQDHLTLQLTAIEDFSILDLVIAGEPLPLHLLPPPQPIPQWGPPRPPQQGLNQHLGPQASNHHHPPPHMGPPPNSRHHAAAGQQGFHQPGQYQSGPRRNTQQGSHQPHPEHQLGLPTTSHQEMGSRAHQRPPQALATASGSGSNQRLMVRVKLPNQAMPVEVEVKPWDRVETLRIVLCEALGRSLRFPPLGQGLCFHPNDEVRC